MEDFIPAGILYFNLLEQIINSDKKPTNTVPSAWSSVPLKTYLSEIRSYEAQEDEHQNIEHIIYLHQTWKELLPLVNSIHDGEGKDKFFYAKKVIIDFVVKAMHKIILILNMSDRPVLCQEAMCQGDMLIKEFFKDLPKELLLMYKAKKSQLFLTWHDLNVLPMIYKK